MLKEDFFLDTALLQVVSSEQANHYRIIPVESSKQGLTFKTDQKSDVLERELEVIFNRNIFLIETPTKTINHYLSRHFRIFKDEKSKTLKYSDDFLEKILYTAKAIGSSDIHFEPYEQRCRVRFRLNGKLKEQFLISLEEYPILINKLKIQAGLDISEKRLPQDGRISDSKRNEAYDIRVSTLPTLYGEKIVLRILNKDADNIALEQLGFHKSALDIYSENIKKSLGIVLISGPTGSGKTTTLYATLKLLNKPHINIITIEDPIE